MSKVLIKHRPWKVPFYFFANSVLSPPFCAFCSVIFFQPKFCKILRNFAKKKKKETNSASSALCGIFQHPILFYFWGANSVLSVLKMANFCQKKTIPCCLFFPLNGACSASSALRAHKKPKFCIFPLSHNVSHVHILQFASTDPIPVCPSICLSLSSIAD